MSEVSPRRGKGIKPVLAQIPAADAFGALREIVSAGAEYGRIRQQEKTKRALIEAVEHREVLRIQAAEKALRLYFDEVFAERKKTTDELFTRLDEAMVTGDPQMVHAVVRGIVDLAQASPLSGVEDFGKFWAELGTDANPIQL